jgi:hypothetical protein
MRLDEIEESGKELKNEADSLLEEAKVNFAQVEKLRQMHVHLKELSYDVESTSLQEARDEATRAQVAYEEQLREIQARRQVVETKNADLLARCEDAITKTRRALNKSEWKEDIKQEGKSWIGEAIHQVTGLNRPAWSESNPRMQAIFAKAQEHLTRLEKAQKQLQEGRQVLKRIDQ